MSGSCGRFFPKSGWKPPQKTQVSATCEEFIRTHPAGAEIDLSVLCAEADVAFRSGEPTDDSLVGRKICDSVWAIYASKSYIQQHGRPAGVATWPSTP